MKKYDDEAVTISSPRCSSDIEKVRSGVESMNISPTEFPSKRQRTTKFKEVFRDFWTTSKKNSYQVEFDYISYKLIECLKKVMNKLIQGEPIENTYCSEESGALWNALKNLSREVTDPQYLCSNLPNQRKNRAYVWDFFGRFNSEPFIEVYIDLIFSKGDSRFICRNLKIKCCRSPSRNCCKSRWEKVRLWLKHEFILELKEQGMENFYEKAQMQELTLILQDSNPLNSC